MSEIDPVQKDVALTRLKEYEDHIRLGRSLGLDTTLIMQSDAAISIFSLARAYIAEATTPIKKPRLWLIGASCFWLGVFAHWFANQ